MSALGSADVLEHRIALAALFPVAHEDADELLHWLLTGGVPGDFEAPTPFLLADADARCAAFAFVVEHTGLGPYLGRTRSPAAIAVEIAAWLDAPDLAPIPRHYAVRVSAGHVQLNEIEAMRDIARVAQPPSKPYVGSWPDDAF